MTNNDNAPSFKYKASPVTDTEAEWSKTSCTTKMFE